MKDKTHVIYCPVTQSPMAYVTKDVHEEFERAVGLRKDEPVAAQPQEIQPQETPVFDLPKGPQFI